MNVATLDDMKVLYSGFDLCSPTTSVSMTINGPAPSILAMFMNTAIDQNLDKFKADFKAAWSTDIHPINAKWPSGKDKVRQEELAAQLISLGQPITEVFVS